MFCWLRQYLLQLHIKIIYIFLKIYKETKIARQNQKAFFSNQRYWIRIVKGTANFKTTTTEIEKQHTFNVHHKILFNRFNFNDRNDIEITFNFDFVSQEINLKTDQFTIITSSFCELCTGACDIGKTWSNFSLKCGCLRQGATKILSMFW